MIDTKYLAGLVDGDGFIGIVKEKRGKFARYRLALKVSMTHKPTIKELHREIGGYYQSASNGVGHRNLFTCIVLGDDALKTIRRIYPHLKVKKKEAKIAIEYQEEIKRDRKQGKEKLRFCEKNHVKLQKLKRVGYPL